MKKAFYDLKGVEIICVGEEKPLSYLRTDNKKDVRITHLGDPIFIVDEKEHIIKSYVVKVVCSTLGGHMILKCSEKGKNKKYIPTVNDFLPTHNLFKECLVIKIPCRNTDAETYLNVSTTLTGAIKLLEMYKSKNTFASLTEGDKIYVVNRISNKIEELIISSIRENNEFFKADKKFTIECTNETRITMGFKYYEGKVSIYVDNFFSYYTANGKWRNTNYYFVFVNKKKAEAFLKEKLKSDENRNVLPKNGTDTKLKDNEGNPILIGDVVAYVNGNGGFIKISTGKVINSSPKMIKIFDEKEKKKYIERQELINKGRKERGLEPYKIDYTDVCIKNITTNKVLVIKR